MATRPAISAHRGACGVEVLPLAESYDRAIRLGVDYVEFDARRTADGHHVVHHDPALPSGPPIASLTLREYRAAAGNQALEIGELVELARGRVRLHVDLKTIGDEDGVLASVKRRLAPDEFVVTTLEDASVRRVKERHPDVRVGLSLGRDMTGGRPWSVAVVRISELYPEPRVRRCGADFLAVHRRLARIRVLACCSRNQLGAWVWTVDEEAEIRAFLDDRRVEVLITNRPDLALALRDPERRAVRRGGQRA